MLLERLQNAFVQRRLDQGVEVEELVGAKLLALRVNQRLKLRLPLLHQEVLDAGHELADVADDVVRVRLRGTLGTVDEVLHQVPKFRLLVLGKSAMEEREPF